MIPVAARYIKIAEATERCSSPAAMSARQASPAISSRRRMYGVGGRFWSRFRGDDMTLERMDNVGIVVESLDEVISFFVELGLKLEGRAMIEGDWAGRVTGLGSQRVEIAMLVTPDGHSRLELSRFLTPPVVAVHRSVMFAVSDIDE